MEQSIFLAREVLNGDAEALRRLLADETRSDRAATDLLIALDRARRDREISYCVLWPCAGEESAGGWRIHFAYAAPQATNPEVEPEMAGA